MHVAQPLAMPARNAVPIADSRAIRRDTMRYRSTDLVVAHTPAAEAPAHAGFRQAITVSILFRILIISQETHNPPSPKTQSNKIPVREEGLTRRRGERRDFFRQDEQDVAKIATAGAWEIRHYNFTLNLIILPLLRVI